MSLWTVLTLIAFSTPCLASHYSQTTSETATYEHRDASIHLSAAIHEYSLASDTSGVRRFHLDYAPPPGLMGWKTRRMLGDRPFTVTADDVEIAHFGDADADPREIATYVTLRVKKPGPVAAIRLYAEETRATFVGADGKRLGQIPLVTNAISYPTDASTSQPYQHIDASEWGHGWVTISYGIEDGKAHPLSIEFRELYHWKSSKPIGDSTTVFGIRVGADSQEFIFTNGYRVVVKRVGEGAEVLMYYPASEVPVILSEVTLSDSDWLPNEVPRINEKTPVVGALGARFGGRPCEDLLLKKNSPSNQ